MLALKDSTTKNAGSGELSEAEAAQAAQTELMIRAGRIWSPSMIELASCLMHTERVSIIKRTNPQIDDEKANTLFENVAGILFKCIRLQQMRSCVAATQRLSSTLADLTVEAVMTTCAETPILHRKAVKTIATRSAPESIWFCVGPIWNNTEAASKANAWVEENRPGEELVFTGHWYSEDPPPATGATSYCKFEPKQKEKTTPVKLMSGASVTSVLRMLPSAKRALAQVQREVDMEKQLIKLAVDTNGTDARGSVLVAMSLRESADDDTLPTVEDPAAKLGLAQRGCHQEVHVQLPDLRNVRDAPLGENKFSFSDQVGVMKSLADTVATFLCCTREFSQRSKFDAAEPDKSLQFGNDGSLMSDSELKAHTAGEFILDPRFLVFEFVSPFMLRGMQVDICTQFMQDAQREMTAEEMHGRHQGHADFKLFTRRSAVKQMIMGAGKTTVIAPLLCVVLADGKTLVSQIVPDALLAMSRDVMFGALSNVFNTRVYTMEFERSSLNDAKLDIVGTIYTKAVEARECGGVVVTTPNSVKSFMLAFIDMVRKVAEFHPACFLDREFFVKRGQEQEAFQRLWSLRDIDAQADKLNHVMRLWRTGVCLVDEVDMVLHPLRSETNFPIGDKKMG